MTDAELAHTKELAFWMTERVFMNPISAKLLNEDWRKAFPDEVAIAERMKALVEALEKAQKRISRLESRSVKLPKAMSIEGGAYCSAHAHYDSDGDYYDRADVEEMLSAAGIKLEDE
ncbi:hypothetical protein [Klebsiella sp. Q2]|uniref:hypothetical protein n=1 Tax=Klebsiella sp. Q2 TaxID=2697364 RepID=UPI0013577A92|nr:hypothetical protein [Klebsiella sp. Q2]